MKRSLQFLCMSLALSGISLDQSLFSMDPESLSALIEESRDVSSRRVLAGAFNSAVSNLDKPAEIERILKCYINIGGNINAPFRGCETTPLTSVVSAYIEMKNLKNAPDSQNNPCKHHWSFAATMDEITAYYKNVIRILIGCGAYSDVPDAIGDTPLIIAARGDCDDIVRFLIENDNLRGLTQAADEWRDCPLDILHSVIQPMLPVHGIDLADSDGNTAFLWAARNNNLNTVQYILDLGADINHKDNGGITALNWAAYNNNLDMVQYLLGLDADVNIQGELNNTPLIWASDRPNLAMAQSLVDKGADINHQNIDGETPLMFAAKHDSHELATYLLSKGADKLLINVDGRRAADLTEDPALVILLS